MKKVRKIDPSDFLDAPPKKKSAGRRGRPPNENPEEVKLKMIGVRVNDAEMEELIAAAERAGFKKVGSWLRKLGLDEAAASRPRKKK